MFMKKFEITIHLCSFDLILLSDTLQTHTHIKATQNRLQTAYDTELISNPILLHGGKGLVFTKQQLINHWVKMDERHEHGSLPCRQRQA